MNNKLICLFSFVLVLSIAGNASAELVLHLPLENAQNPTDASANPATIVLHGSLNSVEGKLDNALEFNGDNANCLEVISTAKLEGMSALSIAAWVLPRNIAGREGMSIVSKRVAWADGDVYNLFTYDGQLVNGRINANNVNIGLSTTALEDDTWYHIALVFN